MPRSNPLFSRISQPLHPENIMISAFTRREFTKLALTALPAAGMFSALNPLRAAASGGKPNSRVAGVHIGLNVPYSFGGRTMAGDEILKNCRELNLSAVELRAQPVELFMGMPAIMVAAKTGSPKAGAAADGLPRLLAPDLPSNCYSKRGVNSSHCSPGTRSRPVISCHYLSELELGNLRACCLP